MVFDDADVLSDAEEDAADARLRELADSAGVGVWVVYVDEFTDPTSSEEWANAAAELNGLGPNQYLLAIAVDSRQLYLSADDSGPVSFDQIATIEQDYVIPALGGSDWAAAVDAVAEGFTEVSGGSNPSSPGVSNVLTIALVVIVVVVIVVLIIVIVAVRRRKNRGASPGSQPQVPIEELARQAGSALVSTDDAIRTSEQELGFATAQFGEQATLEFSAALANAREKLTQAFTLKQQLEDTTPDSEEQARAWNTEILRLTDEADTDLDEKSAAFDELRALEADAPAALQRARAGRDAAASGVDAAAANLQSLRATYAPEALDTVDDNIDQARSRVAFADEQLTAADKALSEGDRGEAAVSIRAAEDAVEQAVVLENGVDALSADFAAAESQAARVIAGLDDDLRVAQSMPDTDGRIAAAVTETRARIDAAQADLASTARRPLETLARLEEADRGIDQVLQSVRDAQEQAQRYARQLDTMLSRAQAQISAAENFIAARRGAVGADARTRLAEAGVSLSRALAVRATDPAAAVAEAQRAESLASDAIRLARTDVGGFSAPANYGSSGGAGDSFFGAMLGGIVGDMLTGGGGGGGGSWGSGGSWSSGGSSRRSTGFGGGGSRRRSGGGGFGGGSRSRRGGGRF
jgi:uncharacterized membrane protein YgcG